MHTTSEPTLIFHKLFPNIQGNLLEQRAGAKKSHDTVRQQLILEPRGHWDIYDAILRQKTELVALAETDIGVLFMHDDGFSTMDGRAAIDLDRFFVDTHDLAIFLRRNELKNNRVSETTVVDMTTSLNIATRSLKAEIDADSDIQKYPRHLDLEDLGVF
ncbi:unnamed protein product [Diplocarpon coronariae]|nr:proline racemase [Diplocarpon mali]